METTIYQLSVCPHDTAKNLAGWYLLNTYLQRNLGCDIHFNLQDNFIVEREAVLAGGYHLVYANPYSAMEFAEKLGFIPVARPVGVFDETILVVRKGTKPLELASPKVSTATKGLIVHALGCMQLGKLGKDPHTCEIIVAGNHMKAAQAVIKGEADIGFVFNETWQGMNAVSKESLEVIGETREGYAFHCFCISPEWADRKSRLLEILTGMQQDTKGGSRILEDLKFKGFEPVPDNTIELLERIVAQNKC
jgi:phosphonate transport system substrate-binding protein